MSWRRGGGLKCQRQRERVSQVEHQLCAVPHCTAFLSSADCHSPFPPAASFVHAVHFKPRNYNSIWALLALLSLPVNSTYCNSTFALIRTIILTTLSLFPLRYYCQPLFLLPNIPLFSTISVLRPRPFTKLRTFRHFLIFVDEKPLKTSTQGTQTIKVAFLHSPACVTVTVTNLFVVAHEYFDDDGKNQFQIFVETWVSSLLRPLSGRLPLYARRKRKQGMLSAPTTLPLHPSHISYSISLY